MIVFLMFFISLHFIHMFITYIILLSACCRPSISQIQEAARFQLFFQSQLPCTFFTGKGIKSKDKMPIQIAIKDATNQTVTSGPLSSLKIKIVVIKGDFNNDGQATWSKNEFYSHIQPERYGKRPLLTGELNIKMQNGVGCIIDASFTDNSSWTRSGKFRLGAVVSESTYTGERVQEAMTEAFKVKDGRLECKFYLLRVFTCAYFFKKDIIRIIDHLNLLKSKSYQNHYLKYFQVYSSGNKLTKFRHNVCILFKTIIYDRCSMYRLMHMGQYAIHIHTCRER